MSPLLCFGEISWDIATQVDVLPEGESDTHAIAEWRGPGGCAFNTAAALSTLQIPTQLFGNSIADDLNGQNFRKSIQAYKHLSWHDISSSNHATPTCQILIEQKTGRRSFILSHQGIQNVPQETIQKARIALKNQKFKFAFIQCYLRKATLSLLRGLKTKTSLMTQDLEPHDDLLRFFDLLQISLPKNHDTSKASLQALCQPYFQNGTKQILVTCGSQGVFYGSQFFFEGSQTSRKKSKTLYWIFQEQTNHPGSIDTTGCGDAFRAGFLFGLIKQKSISESLQYGQKLGADQARIKGSCLPASYRLRAK